MTFKTSGKASMVVAAGTLMILTAAGTASAQSMEDLSKVDANGDGSIEWQEMINMREASFARLDRNSDGYADSNDSPNFGPGKSRFSEALAKLEGADANGDGRIAKAELIEAPAPMFEQGDTDGDKVLSADELTALRETAERS